MEHVTGYFLFSTYFKDREATNRCSSALITESRSNGFLLLLQMIPIQDEDWTEYWHPYFEPIEVGALFRIHPPWITVPDDGRYQIIINPGQGFGTGYHESTALMVRMLECIPLRGMKVLDIGCGSGILAIGARKMKCGLTAGLDRDPQAVRESADNAGLNGEKDIRWFIGTPDAVRPGTFDVVLANLDYSILTSGADLLAGTLKSGGTICISGFQSRHRKDLIERYQSLGLTLIRSDRLNDWACLVFG
ncbi:50S ribosomal protein L11 methyltransferase [bacterium]|nr:50S ribosomal protein L11 methyltransferase [candidate division CSSED10-310 bacterium]